MFVQVDRRPGRELGWATPLLLVLVVFAFIWLASQEPDRFLRTVSHWGLMPARLFDPDADWAAWFAELRPLAMLTALLIHVDLLHLIGNLLFLLIFGLAAERRLGSGLFLALFLVGGVLANLAAAATMPDWASSSAPAARYRPSSVPT